MKAVIRYSWNEAIENARSNPARFPAKSDPRILAHGAFPALKPRFQFMPGASVFTIGSCFARNIEEKLTDFRLPTRRFAAPKDEWPARPNGLLNEFNPGTMHQRIMAAIERRTFGAACAVEVGEEK